MGVEVEIELGEGEIGDNPGASVWYVRLGGGCKRMDIIKVWDGAFSHVSVEVPRKHENMGKL